MPFPSRLAIGIAPTLLSLALAVPSFAATYYVGGTGASDSNPGTSAQPWATIQKAATVATAGDTINIRTGTYRETVTPANSGTSGNPITYQPDGNATVIVSGADTANGGWTVHSGSIYKKAIALPVTGYNDHITSNNSLLANQVFVAGKMMVEARWPNVSNSDDLMNRNDFRRTTFGTWTNTSGSDPGIPSIPDPNGWAGGTLWMNGWYVSRTRTIASHSGSQITWTSSFGDPDGQKREYYYLTGKLGALDAEKEWFYDGTYLYFRAPGSVSPTNVEVKMRNWAFVLNGRSHITLKNLHLFAASIGSDASSTNTILDGLQASYINHSVTLPNGIDVAHGYNDPLYSHTEETGIRLMGENSVIRNSTIRYSSDQGIVLGGGNVADNNLLHDISYAGTYACAIAPAPHEDGQQIKNNTVYRTGRSAVDLRENLAVNIERNEFYDYGLINVDLGAIYAARQDDLTGTRIHYNWIHDSKVALPASGTQAGIYFDQDSGPALVHHNVVWNNGSVSNAMDLYNHKQNASSDPHQIYNNTFVTTAANLSYKNACEGPLVLDDLKNNIFRDTAQNRYLDSSTTPPQVVFVAITAPTNNLFSATAPTFLGSGAGGLAYRLANGSAGINQGVVITGVTDGYLGGAPDTGAYEFGGVAWVPGYTAITPMASPAAGTYGTAQSVTLSTRTLGATIRYTTDGSTPTSTSGTIYTGPINVAASVTLKAIAYLSGVKDSALMTASYTITGSSPEVLARYEFTSSSLASNDTNPNSTAANFDAGSGYTNLSFNNTQRRVTGAGINGTAAQNNTAGEYFTTTTAATSGNVLNLSSFTFKAIRTTSSADHITVYAIPSGGPNHGQTLTVIDNAALTLNTLTTYNGVLTGAAYQGIDGIEIRIVFHGSNAGNPTATNSVDDVILEGTVSGGGNGLPSPWLNQDIGGVGLVGSASHSAGTFTINGSGADIWSTADAFHFVYQAMTGDGEIVARVTAIENTHSGAKAGVMIRESLTAGSKHVLMNTTPLPQRQFLRRASTSGTTSYDLGSAAANPSWVRLVRAGNVFTAYESSNGSSWTQLGAAQIITMATNVYVGLVVVSKDNAQLNTSTFTNVNVTP